MLNIVAFAFVGLLVKPMCEAGTLVVPNASFESPAVAPVSPYANPEIDSWQKSPQPAWYDPAQNSNTPWEYLMGEFYNVQFPGQFIDNCDASQAAFIFALPQAALFQDYDSLSGTNAGPTHTFGAEFNVGSSYDLTVAVLGGGGGMKPGVSLQLSFYNRDLGSNLATVAATTITNSSTIFPTNTHFVDFSVHLPQVKAGDAWAGKHIGIQLLSTVDFSLAGGYWDVDNVRLVETSMLDSSLGISAPSNGMVAFTLRGPSGSRVEVQATTNLSLPTWVSLGSFTNSTGTFSFSESATNGVRFYRARVL
jgi:hypothetical protein